MAILGNRRSTKVVQARLPYQAGPGNEAAPQDALADRDLSCSVSNVNSRENRKVVEALSGHQHPRLKTRYSAPEHRVIHMILSGCLRINDETMMIG